MEKKGLSIFGKCTRASDVILEKFMCPCNHQKQVLTILFPLVLLILILLMPFAIWFFSCLDSNVAFLRDMTLLPPL